MSGLVREVQGGDPSAGPRPRVITTERALALIVLGALGTLVFARHAFREFIPQ